MKIPTHTVIIGGMTFNMVHTEDHEEALQAETTRRLEAEKTIDMLCDDRIDVLDADLEAKAYRAKYPK